MVQSGVGYVIKRKHGYKIHNKPGFQIVEGYGLSGVDEDLHAIVVGGHEANYDVS